jgi:predicted lipoprotein with Yx(FWY)xxD motif
MKRPVAFLAVVPAVLALAACGSSSSGGGSSPSSNSSAASATSPVLRVASKAKLGPILVDAQGRTLYRYAPDHGGKSTCTGGCSMEWPPATVRGSGALTAAGVKGTVATTTRPDGTTQLSFDGKPLYRFAQDTTKADANGQGLEHSWFVIPAKGAASTTTTTTSGGGGYSY